MQLCTVKTDLQKAPQPQRSQSHKQDEFFRANATAVQLKSGDFAVDPKYQCGPKRLHK
ncbi:hypothetical protein BIW11_04826 [Tropilaelaps mercedesae]|uniref:Uncharacterized protein n=1 Tax=Tropilaelaps mercedesae TaxID=418985 RepID=A0A1V9X0R9_9ACAR|nr:hypothetical protein BIW11_04826 [Tropilaelaps mercedesae]